MFKYIIWSKNRLLNFPPLGLFCCQTLASLHPGKLAEAIHSVFHQWSMPVFGLVFRVMRTTLQSCCYSVGCSSELSDPLQLSFPIHSMISAKVAPKPQQPQSFMWSPLMLCPKPRVDSTEKRHCTSIYKCLLCTVDCSLQKSHVGPEGIVAI